MHHHQHHRHLDRSRRRRCRRCRYWLLIFIEIAMCVCTQRVCVQTLCLSIESEWIWIWIRIRKGVSNGYIRPVAYWTHTWQFLRNKCWITHFVIIVALTIPSMNGLSLLYRCLIGAILGLIRLFLFLILLTSNFSTDDDNFEGNEMWTECLFNFYPLHYHRT